MLQSGGGGGGGGRGMSAALCRKRSKICAAKFTKSFLKLKSKSKKDMSVGWLKYLKCQQNHSNKPVSGAGSPSCRPGSVQLNL